MRRPSLLICVRAAVIVVPALVACGTSNSPSGFGSGDNQSSSPTTVVSYSNSTYTTVSTVHLADGGISTTTETLTTSVAVTSTVSKSSSSSRGSSPNGSGSGSSSTSTSGSEISDAGGSDSGDAGGLRTCAVASTAVVADFEDGKPIDVAANGFTGPWGAVASTGSAVRQVGVPSPVDPSPSCNKYSLHATVAGPIASGGYGQVRANLLVTNQDADSGEPYSLPKDISAYNAVSFDIMPGSGTNKYPITFEVVDQESTPANDPNMGPNMGLPLGGLASTPNVDEYNHRGWLISNLSSGWQTVTVPFNLLIPHWFPSPGTSGCGTSGMCEAPQYNGAHALSFQFSINPDQDPNGAFDFWVDNVTLVSDPNAGLTPSGMTMPTWHDGTFPGCTKPTGASGKYLMYAYQNWKNQFVKGTAGSSRYVYSPEISGGSVVSEGIGYGMLIAVYFGDQSLFNDLFSFWQSHVVSGTHLMTWKWNSTGSSTAGSGSATDADEDAAFALIEANKKWPSSTYYSYAQNLVSDIFTKEIDSTLIPWGGNQYNSVNPTNPSYFAPAYYPIFKAVDSGHDWIGVQTKVYSVLSTLMNNVSSSDGLLPAWCTSPAGGGPASACTVIGSNSGSQNSGTDGDYQYDAHRIPWRVGLDACWNSATGGKTLLSKNSGFFANIAGTNAIGRIMDMYTPTGGSVSGSAPNSMSMIGTAGVGAMASSNAAFANQAWRFVLDGLNRGALDVSASGNSGYSYYNSTIGLMTALTMSGNFYPM